MTTTRIDLLIIPTEGVLVRKYAEGWESDPSLRPAIHTNTTASLDEFVAWLEAHGWTVRRWPGGARGFLGKQFPVRTKAEIKRLREQFYRFPVKGVEAHALDLAFEW